MSKIQFDKICIKLNSTLKQVDKILEKKGYILSNNYSILNIYMVENRINISALKDLKLLENYAIIEERNRSSTRIILKEHDELHGTLQSIGSGKELLIKLGYKELMYINLDVYEYLIQDFSIQIYDVKNQGIFLKLIDTNKYSNISDVLNILDKLELKFDKTNLFYDNELIELSNIQKKGVKG